VSAIVLLGVSLAYAGTSSFVQSARVSCMLRGQLLGALFLDWSGLLGTAVTPSWERIAGCSLASIGAVMATLRT